VNELVRSRRRQFEFLDGHYPYGIHRFGTCSTSPIYLTILREPLDRAISQYYFIKQCDTADYQHPDLEVATRCDIGEFYALKQHQNIQTKFTAGFVAMKLAEVLPRSLMEPLLLARAKFNLANRYHFFGLVERMAEFEAMVARELGWSKLNIRDHSKVTWNRPSTSAIDGSLKKQILRGNRLDVELYDFAQKVFAKRIERHSGTGSATGG
jgi:hypothetical protein